MKIWGALRAFLRAPVCTVLGHEWGLTVGWNPMAAADRGKRLDAAGVAPDAEYYQTRWCNRCPCHESRTRHVWRAGDAVLTTGWAE